MKVIAIFALLFVAALAAPTVVENVSEKVKAPAQEDKTVKTPEAVVSPSSNAENVGKVESDKVDVEEKKPEETEKVVEKKEEEVKVEDKVEPAKAALSVEETAPVPVAVAPAEEETKPAEDDETEKKKKMEETSAICLASTGATLEQVTAISDKPEDDAPKEVKCYVKCIDEQLGIVKDQVVQNVAFLAANPSKSTPEASETVDACGTLETDDPCDSSYLRYSCYFRTTGKKIQIV